MHETTSSLDPERFPNVTNMLQNLPVTPNGSIEGENTRYSRDCYRDDTEFDCF